VAPVAAQPIMETEPQNADQFAQELHGRTEEYTRQLNELHKGDTPEPKFSQADPLKGFASLGGVIGVFGSLLSKQPLVSALNASASAMGALKQGNVEEYANKVKEWSMHRDYVMQVEGNISKQYNAILADKKLTYQEKVAEQRALLAQTNANAHLALASANHTLAVDKYYRQLENDALTRGDKARAEGIHIINSATAHMTQEDAIKTNIQMSEALRTPGFNAGMAADILTGKAAKPQSGAGAIDPAIVSRLDNIKPGETMQVGPHTLSYDDARKVLKTTPNQAGDLSPAQHAAWVMYQKGISAPQGRSTVAQQDTGTSYTVGQIINKDGKKYKVVGDPGPNPDVIEIP
jgi:hypothetical protein